MRFPLIAILLTGFALAIGLLGLVEFTKSRSNDLPNTAEGQSVQTSESGEPSAVRPVIFAEISEANNMLRMSGTGEGDATLSILSGGAVAQQTRIDADGRWSVTLPTFGSKSQMIETVLTLPSGDNIRGEQTVFRIPHPAEGETVDDVEMSPNSDADREPNTPVSNDVAVDVPTTPFTKPPLILVTSPGSPSTLIQTPFGTTPTSGPLSLGPIDYDNSGGAVFRGTSERAGRVRLSVQGGGVIGDAPVLDDGQWFFMVSDTLPVGRYNMSVTLMSPDQDDIRITVPFERLSPRRAREAQGFAVSALYGEDNWQVRRELLGGGAQYTVIFARGLNAPKPDINETDTPTP